MDCPNPDLRNKVYEFSAAMLQEVKQLSIDHGPLEIWYSGEQYHVLYREKPDPNLILKSVLVAQVARGCIDWQKKFKIV